MDSDNANVTSETHEDSISPVRAFISIALVSIEQWWAVLLPLLITARLAYKRYASPLRSYPGPFWASCSRVWKVKSTFLGRTNWDHVELHKKYGPIVRIAPDEVSFSSPQVARHVLAAGKRFTKTDFYWVFPPPENPDIFTEIRSEVNTPFWLLILTVWQHAMKKKVANVPYSMAAMRQLSPFIDDTVEFFMSRLESYCPASDTPGFKQAGVDTKPQTVDLGKWLHYFAFDVLGEVAFGRSFGFLAAGFDKEDAIKTIDNSQRYNGVVGQIPEFDYLLRRNPLLKLIPALDPSNYLITRIAKEEMNKRRPFEVEREGKGANSDGREDLLASLIKGHLKDRERFHEGDVFSVAHGAIFAGSDSTASTMQSLFWLILSTPRVYATITAETDAAVQNGTISSTGNIDWAEAQSLSYFQACLKEAMRLRPAVGLNMTRHAPSEGVDLEGHHFPGGTRLAMNGWVLHRDREIFGEDADLYRPERWLDDEENAKVMERYMFQFGGGAHICIGRNLAILEINKVCPRLLRDYEFQLVDPTRELKATATFFVIQEGLEVYISRKGPSKA
ncbi:Uu.00g006500.m01.CDS01 [Anthostomella pinea]|uniref:Uu.00g006500.m01.CDS01 n=1 Tax=Anthostomella pinea TaxID=933095 RepID=A0AAI8VLH0_9PEZI|nr:Uu.00g006500.m01.CDS01 [Anthostomella pinea]